MLRNHILLVADDDQDDREMFIEVVTEICPSLKCIKASNGKEALILVENEQISPDLIFLDLNMPRMNGRQCLKHLKENEKTKAIPVIIYTTSKLEKDKQETQKLGAVHFITKPTSMTVLKKELEYVFSQDWSHK